MQPDVPAQGTVLWIRQQRWRVERARREKHVVRLDVAGSDGRATFLAPFDRPHTIASTDRLRYVRPQGLVARLAGLLGKEELHSRALPAAAGARIQILPYQLEPALALLTSTRRALIADAVGLGKTIQAGVLIAELRRRTPALRALVAVPAALRTQWRDELRAHFGIETMCADAAALDDLARFQARASAPWDRAGVWIGSIDYLKQPHVLRGAVRHVWDLLVIDEAHGVCGATERHTAANALGRCSRRILLLSATPHSGVEAQFERLLAIGALACFENDQTVIFRRTRADLGMVADRRTRHRAVRLSTEETRLLDALAAFERVIVTRGHRGEGLLLLSVFRKRALSTIAACQRSIERRLSFIDGDEDGWLQGSLFPDDEDDICGDDRAALAANIGLEGPVERSWLRRLRALAIAASRRESKMRRVLTFVRRSREPLAIFTEFRDSLNALLPRIAAVRAAAFLHGGLHPDEQQRQLDRFLCGDASILIATDVASQGLNLQSRCRCVLNLELPWNPSRLEQRAGRVDRIGQHRRVHVGLFVARHDADADMLSRMTLRARAAHRSAPPSTRWSRPARAIARRLHHQRALGSNWRGPVTSRRPCAARTAIPRHLRCVSEASGLLLFAVPIFDGAGDVIERRHVCVAIAAEAKCRSDAIDAARDLARRHLAPRVRRLCRLRRRNAATSAELERAIVGVMTDRSRFSDLQPGLFDRRAVDADHARAADAAEVLQALQGRLDALEAETQVVAGTPVLAAVICAAQGPERPG